MEYASGAAYGLRSLKRELYVTEVGIERMVVLANGWGRSTSVEDITLSRLSVEDGEGGQCPSYIGTIEGMRRIALRRNWRYKVESRILIVCVSF